MLVFEERVNRSTRRKTSRSKGQNQQRTQPTYGFDAGIWTRATLVEDECSHHCAILAPLGFTISKVAFVFKDCASSPLYWSKFRWQNSLWKPKKGYLNPRQPSRNLRNLSLESHEFFLLHFTESRYPSKFDVIGFPTLFNKTIKRNCGFEVYSWRLMNVLSLNLNYGSVREK